MRLTNEVTGRTQIVADLTAVTQQQAGSCTLLDLTIQPIDLDFLGLHLHTDTIHLVLTAQRGTLLGNLLCGLFFGNSSWRPLYPGGAATTLNQLLPGRDRPRQGSRRRRNYSRRVPVNCLPPKQRATTARESFRFADPKAGN